MSISLLIIGSSAGIVAGLIHAWGLYSNQAHRGAKTLYVAFWTILLWSLFGAYVLYLWLFAVALYYTNVFLHGAPIRRFRRVS